MSKPRRTVFFDPDLDQYLQGRAMDEKRTFSYVVNECLQEYRELRAAVEGKRGPVREDQRRG